MPEPLSIYTRRVERLERDLRRERVISTVIVVVFLLFFGTFLAAPALAIWSSLRGWDAGTACNALGLTGGVLTLLSGGAGALWLTFLMEESVDGELEKARDEYDRAVEQAVRDAR